MPSKTSKPTRSPRQGSRAESICSEPELRKLARELAATLKAGDRVVLEGPMGAGKTTFARELLDALGVVQPPEGSPSFAIAHEYRSPRADVIHLDFYRIRHAQEIEEAGIPEYFWQRQAIVISEWLSSWPELEGSVLASSGRVVRVELSFHEQDDARRRVAVIA